MHPLFQVTYSFEQVEKLSTIIDPEVSLLCLQQPTTHLYPEPYESNSHPLALSIPLSDPLFKM
jgi:hypothetical protein